MSLHDQTSPEPIHYHDILYQQNTRVQHHHLDGAALQRRHVGRVTTQRAAGEDVDLQLAARLLGDLLGPGVQVLGLVERLRGAERASRLAVSP